MSDNDQAPEPFDDPFKGGPDSSQQPSQQSSPAPSPSYTAPPDVGKPPPSEGQGASAKPPDYGTPPTPATPPVTTGSVKAPETTVKKAEPAHTLTDDDILRMNQERLEQDKKEWDDYLKLQAPLNRRVLQMLTEKPPDVPQPPTTPPPPSQQENINGLKKSAIGYLAVALPLAILMGAKGGWAFAGAWGGFGKGLTALTEGNQKAADDAYQHALDIDRIANEKFNQQMQVYSAVLANRNATTQQMMDMINFNAKLFTDRKTEEQTEANNWDGMLKVLQDKQDAKRKYDEFISNTFFRANTMKRLGHSSTYNDWKDLINQEAIKQLGHTMDPESPKSEEERQILQKYPMEKFWKAHPKTPPAAPGSEAKPEGPFGEEEGDMSDEHLNELLKDYTE